MKVFALLLSIIKSFLGVKQAKEENRPQIRLTELTNEAAQLRHDILLAARLGNSSGLSELQTRLDANHAERDALRSPGRPESK